MASRPSFLSIYATSYRPQTLVTFIPLSYQFRSLSLSYNISEKARLQAATIFHIVHARAVVQILVRWSKQTLLPHIVHTPSWNLLFQLVRGCLVRFNSPKKHDFIVSNEFGTNTHASFYCEVVVRRELQDSWDLIAMRPFTWHRLVWSIKQGSIASNHD